MVITATEFKVNMGKYLAMAAYQDIYITKNGKSIAKLTSPAMDKVAALDSLVGAIPNNMVAEDVTEYGVKEERLRKQ